jgi:hypothetical protein
VPACDQLLRGVVAGAQHPAKKVERVDREAPITMGFLGGISERQLRRPSQWNVARRRFRDGRDALAEQRNERFSPGMERFVRAAPAIGLMDNPEDQIACINMVDRSIARRARSL